MPKQADGSIVVNTELSTKGFKAGSQELKQAIKSLNTEMKSMGPSFKKALSGNTEAIKDTVIDLKFLGDAVAIVEKGLQDFANAKIPTDKYTDLSKELDKAEKHLQSLNEKQSKMQMDGVKKNSQKWKNLQNDINYATQKIAGYRSQMQKMENSGTAFKLGLDTAEFSQSAKDLENLIGGIKEKTNEFMFAELPTAKYQALKDEIFSLDKKLEDLNRKQLAMESIGVDKASKDWKNLEKDISAVKQKILLCAKEMDILQEEGKAFNSGMSNSDYTRITSTLEQARSSLQSMVAAEKSAVQSATSLAGPFARTKSYFSALKTEMQKAPPLTEQLRSSMTAVGQALYKVAQIAELPIAGLMLLPNIAKLGAVSIINAFSSVGTRISNIAATAKSKFLAISPAIKNAISDPVGTAKSLFDSLNQKAGSVVAAVRKIGSSILSGTVNGLRQAVTSGAGLARSLGGKALSGVKRLGRSIKTGLSNGLKKSVGLAKRFFSSMKKDSKSSGGAISKLGKKITGLGGMLKRMALRKIVSGIFNGAKEGFNNLAQYSSGVNSNLSTLKSGLTQLKNSFATAFAPILNVVTPILSKLIGYLSQAATYVGKLFAALTGQKTFTKATAVQEDYAASLNNSAKAAESSSERQAASFDDLNVLSDSSSSSDNSNDGNASVSEMFEEVPIESSILDFMGRIKDAFKNGNFAEIGEILGNGINTAVQKVHDFISWDNVGGVVTKVIKGVAEGFNSLIYTINWENIGSTVAQGLNTVLNTLYLIITEFDWPAVAAALARSLNGLVSDFDWNKLGTLISTGFITAIKSLRSAISTFDWASLGKGVADSINAIDWVGAFSELAGLLSDAIIGLLDLCIGFMEGIDWGKLGSDLWNSLVGIVKNIDWGALVEKAFRLLGNVIGAGYSFVFGIAKSVWESLKSAFMDSAIYFMGYVNEAGGNIIQGLWNGICDAFKNAGNWIWEHIFVPFWDGIRNAFGIHSPSTKMAEIGKYIIEGLLNGITNVWNTITSFFGNALSSLKDKINEGWENVKKGTSTAWNNISTSISNNWNNIKSSVSSAVSNVKESALNAWGNIKTSTANVWSNVKNSISNNLNTAKTNASNAWNNIKSTASTIGNNISSTVSTAWNNVKNHVSNNLNTAKTNASNTWNSIKSTASTVGSSVASAANTAWSNVKNHISNNLSAAKTNANNAWNNIKSVVSSVGSSVNSNVSSVWTSIKGYVTNNLNAAKTNASTAWNSIKSTASTVGSNLKTNVSSVWSNIKGYITSNLNTAKSGASTAWSSIKSTASNVGSSIKTNASSAWSSIKGYITNNLNNAKSSASSTWSSIKSTASSNNSSIKSTMSSTWSSIKSTMASRLSEMKSSANSTFKNLKTSATTWGKDVCLNMANGIKNAMHKVSDACTDVAKKIKSLLGFSEPEDGPLSNFHTYMPDMIDLMVYGIKKNQGQAIGAVANMAGAISEEIQNGDYALSNLQASGNVNSAFNSFSDKIVNGFDNLINRLQAIAESVTFTMPQTAVSGVIPYSVSSTNTSTSNGRVEELINASNEELASVVIQSVTNATSAIVTAIQNYSGPTVNIDRNSLTTGIIEDIKRRTLMMGGKSALDT